MAIGFETTAPASALLLEQAARENLKNIQVLCLHVLTPPAMATVLSNLSREKRPHAIIGPGHVSLVTGMEIYERIVEEFKLPIVISGFDGEDLQESIRLCEELIQNEDHKVHNQYRRAIQPGQEKAAQALLNRFFQIRSNFHWRGLGNVENSAYEVRPEWSQFNAELNLELQYRSVP